MTNQKNRAVAALVAGFLTIAGCNAALDGPPDRPPQAGQDAGSPTAADAGPLSFRYCNRDLPQNQTKFVAADVLPAGDGGGCELNYTISFGTIGFACSCAPDACAAALAALAAEAAACTSPDAGQ